jgi:hypothetical protein
MAYNNKETLKDVKGNPVPQIYDPVADAYKPLTKTEFFGNSSETKPTTNVDKGSTFYEFDTGTAYIFNGTSWQVL